jgi:hypothetical protein
VNGKKDCNLEKGRENKDLSTILLAAIVQNNYKSETLGIFLQIIFCEMARDL